MPSKHDPEQSGATSIHCPTPAVDGAIVRDIGTNCTSLHLSGASSVTSVEVELIYINIYTLLTERNVPVSPFMQYWTHSELVRYLTKHLPNLGDKDT